jgi:acyl carrier protein
MVTRAMNDAIRAILRDHARLSVDALSLADDTDLFKAGMSSHASVNVMLALEGKFDVEFPDRMMTRDVFGSIAHIRGALEELTKGA